MKKLVLIGGIIILIFIIWTSIVIHNDNKYIDNIKDNIYKNTELDEINYINKYDNYYIVRDKKYVYVFDMKYNEIVKIDNILVYENKKNYDIIYKDDIVMYSHEYYKKNILYCDYYDLYKYTLIKTVSLGE
jgi:hypothetical protein